jgi:transcriptional regulator with XRE-family HTH domain
MLPHLPDLRNSETNVACVEPLTPCCLTNVADLGAAVRARRREQSLRIDDAAALLGVSVDLLSRLENSKGSVRLDKLLLVLDGLGLALVLAPKEHPWFQSLDNLTPTKKP